MALRRMISFDRATPRPFSLFTARQDADEVARANTEDDTEGWRYKVVKRSSGFVVEMYDNTDTYQGVL